MDITIMKRVFWIVISSLVTPIAMVSANEHTEKNQNNGISQVIKGDIQRQLHKQKKAHNWILSELKISTILPSGSHRLNCSKPLEIVRRDKRIYPAGRLRYRISCPEPSGWSIHAQADSRVKVPVVYAKNTIAKDAIVRKEDLETRLIDLANLNREFVSTSSRIINQRAQRQIRQGQPIAPERISEPFIIQRGEQVIMLAIGDKFSTSTSGVALENGYQDQQIRVRNTSSGKTIQAVVVEQGRVQTLF
ncbi:flagellar basal body P-ring formation chaperone FlgA [Vibrio sp.]|uniref:flagellar basal body P-ring formation chaperone FlgA n=1 Tax=Vibrio sp. TaxID=678 RepID=UPI0037996B8F